MNKQQEILKSSSYFSKHKERKNGSSVKPYSDIESGLLIEKQPIISVIIPVLQEEKILEKTLKTYTDDLRSRYNLEIIVSDGGSIDRTLEIAEKYADVVIRHNKTLKQTISEGRNRGAEAANGNCLVFINGDTIPENPDSFFEFISKWCRGDTDCSDAVALACPVTVTPEEKLLKDSIFYTCHNFYVRLLNSIGLGMGRGECQIIKSSAFKAIGGYSEKLAAGEDFDLYRRIGKHGKIKFANSIRVFESPRRFRKYGYLKIIFSWTINSLYVMFFGRSMSDEWEAVR